MFFEHLKLYVAKGPVPEEPYRIPLGVADVRRAGSDVTDRRDRGDGRPRARRRPSVLADAGTSVEVIDPRTLSPLDVDTIVASVEKTGALVVVDESPPHCSVASEIAAVVTEQAFDFLNGPGAARDRAARAGALHPVARGGLRAVGAGDRRRRRSALG